MKEICDVTVDDILSGNMCRTCLSTTSELISFYDNKFAEISLFELVMSFTSIKVS